MVSIKVTGMVITLLTFCLLVTETSAVTKYHRCCRSYMKNKLPFRVIVGYSVQYATENCPISAIIFHTKKEKDACTNPGLNWVMDYINRLRAQAQIAHKDLQAKE